MNRFEAAPEAAMLPVEEVVSLHNLVMGGLRQQQIDRGRMVRRDYTPRKYKFCMLDMSESLPRDNSGAVDTYLGVILAKPHTRYWSLLVSFLEGRNTEVDATSNQRTIYRMDWTKTEAYGIRWGVETIGNLQSQVLLHGISKEEAELELLEGNSVQRESQAEFMRTEDLYFVRSRVHEISSAIMVASELMEERRLRRRPNIL